MLYFIVTFIGVNDPLLMQISRESFPCLNVTSLMAGWTCLRFAMYERATKLQHTFEKQLSVRFVGSVTLLTIFCHSICQTQSNKCNCSDFNFFFSYSSFYSISEVDNVLPILNQTLVHFPVQTKVDHDPSPCLVEEFEPDTIEVIDHFDDIFVTQTDVIFIAPVPVLSLSPLSNSYLLTLVCFTSPLTRYTLIMSWLINVINYVINYQNQLKELSLQPLINLILLPDTCSCTVVESFRYRIIVINGLELVNNYNVVN